MINALYDESKTVEENLKELFAAVGNIVQTMNEKEAATVASVIYSGGDASGTVKIPRSIMKYTLFLALVGREPIVCARYNAAISGKGIDENLFCTISGDDMTFEASNALNAFIVIM